MTDQTNTPPSFATLSRLIAEAGTALAAEITRRIEEVRPGMEALMRLIAEDQEARIRACGAAVAPLIRVQQRQEPKP